MLSLALSQYVENSKLPHTDSHIISSDDHRSPQKHARQAYYTHYTDEKIKVCGVK